MEDKPAVVGSIQKDERDSWIIVDRLFRRTHGRWRTRERKVLWKGEGRAERKTSQLSSLTCLRCCCKDPPQGGGLRGGWAGNGEGHFLHGRPVWVQGPSFKPKCRGLQVLEETPKKYVILTKRCRF